MNEQKQVNVRLKKLNGYARTPIYKQIGDSGMDLHTTEDVFIAPGETKIIPTGLAFAVPRGWELQVRDRSGISSKTKLRVANAPGTIDSGYRGEVGVIVDNIRQSEYAIKFDSLGGSAISADIVVKVSSFVETVNGDIEITDEPYPIGTYFIPKGTRIAQAVFCQVGEAQIEVVNDLDETERGEGSYGSTGTE